MTEVKDLKEIAEREVRERAKKLGLEGELDAFVKEILLSNKEVYPYTWAEFVREVVEKLIGEKLRFSPIAGSWDLVVAKGDRILGIASSGVVPYLGWKEFIEALSNIEKQVRELVKKNPRFEKFQSRR